jgi:hypothetical protein
MKIFGLVLILFATQAAWSYEVDQTPYHHHARGYRCYAYDQYYVYHSYLGPWRSTQADAINAAYEYCWQNSSVPGTCQVTKACVSK